MRKILITLSLAMLTTAALAERIQSHIHEIDPGENGEDHLIKLTNGRVIFVDAAEKSLLDADVMEGRKVEVEVDKKSRLKSITSLPDEPMPEETEPPMSEERHEETTVLSSEAEAKRIFNGMNRTYYRRTECTDRAHVWAYEEWKKHNLHSRKVFLFFTNTYIRRYNYHWWFHVSPYTLVGDQERVLDRRFTRTPYSMKNWTDVFIYSRRSCPATTYRHYRQNKNGPEHCFIVKTSMYYRLPLHVRAMEDRGVVKTSFRRGEVNFSYRAFRRRQAR